MAADTPVNMAVIYISHFTISQAVHLSSSRNTGTYIMVQHVACGGGGGRGFLTGAFFFGFFFAAFFLAAAAAIAFALRSMSCKPGSNFTVLLRDFDSYSFVSSFSSSSSFSLEVIARGISTISTLESFSGISRVDDLDDILLVSTTKSVVESSCTVSGVSLETSSASASGVSLSVESFSCGLIQDALLPDDEFPVTGAV